MKVNLDTNIFISVKNKEEDSYFCGVILDAIDENKIKGVVSTIVIAEVLVGFFKNKENYEAERFLNRILANYEIIPVNIEVSRIAAIIKSKTDIRLPDAIVSATTEYSKSDFLISKDLPLIKKVKYIAINPKDFVENYLSNKNE